MYRTTIENPAAASAAGPAWRSSFTHVLKRPFLNGRRLRRALAHTLNIGMLAFIVQAPPAAAFVIGSGWTASEPGGIGYVGPVGGTGTSLNAYTFTINLLSVADLSTTISFVNDGTATNQTYFNISFTGQNSGALPWKGLLFEITDTTTDAIPFEPTDPLNPHPYRAHVHRNAWTAGDFTCVGGDNFDGGVPLNYCGPIGLYDMELRLGAPLAMGDIASGSILRLHDKNEEGNSPMSFNLTITPIPSPGTFALFGLGLACLFVSMRRRHAYPVG